jgi:plasmid stabilization system protein ParE
LVADRFFQTFLQVVERALNSPEFFHPVSPHLRRADIPGFPYHFLYREAGYGIRVLVLRHDRRHPSFGLRRK